ncbi:MULTISPECIES: type I methionyl aminopeptidase [Pseudarthrobacter]|uniref:type I methionyl aminopeptidase n=1 Tax=Pseudarthrobacter TaxID=1742993 RepID=UPI00203E7F0A|nr:type I methionyl aminopeptidase [Pseudarthrobacter sp. NCCP-2145]BFE46159.1 type I methionyl aminopeptidase [Pseudarthrobacter oxydans]GKV70775.1 methionine aminopeptidase [Pseudarthrobacter sp. NCCP-2145]
MIELLTPREIDQARPSGRFVANTLRDLRERTGPGTNLLEINDWAAAMIRAAGARSCYVDYAPSFGRGPFGKVICTSVNDAVLHGLPHDYVLQDGDLLTLDFAASVNGWVTDSAISFVVGDSAAPEDTRMIETTERALAAGIGAAQPGARIGDISHAIGSVLESAKYRVNTQFGGHGVGSTMHQDPHIPNTGRPGRGYELRPGLLLAIEPWVMDGTSKLMTAPDGWTLCSSNGRRTAHSEHTIAVTESGPVILTQPA